MMYYSIYCNIYITQYINAIYHLIYFSIDLQNVLYCSEIYGNIFSRETTLDLYVFVNSKPTLELKFVQLASCNRPVVSSSTNDRTEVLPGY